MTPPRVTPDEWRHVQEIFLAALEKDGDTRSQYLDEVCRGKADLRAEVESLLAHAGSGTRGLAAVVSEAAIKLPASRDRHIDSKLGHYRILNRLNEGGMGVVYLAERSDEHYQQTVRSIAITRELLEISPVSVQYRERLGILERDVAETLGRTNRIPAALSHALVSRDRLIDLIRSQPPRKDYSEDLMKSYCVLADLQHQARDDAGASLSQQGAMHLFNVVAAGEGNLSTDYSLAKCYDIFSRTDAAHSAEWLQKSGERWQTLTAAGVHR